MIAAVSNSALFLELGAVLATLAVVGRLASRLSIPVIPMYLTIGLFLGDGSVFPMRASGQFLHVSAEIGVILLLLLLGIEYTPDELLSGLKGSWRAGVFDLIANSIPGFVAGLLLGWGLVPAIVLAGITYASSSGIIAAQIMSLGRMANRETPTILSILVFEDLVMAVYLPIVGVLLIGGTAEDGAISITIAVAVVMVAMVLASRHGHRVSKLLDSKSPELLLLGILGMTLLVGGFAERVKVSAAIAAFLLGVAIAGRVAERGEELLQPVRDLFGGVFFIYFGFQIDPATLPRVLLPAILLALVGVATKTATGWWAAARNGIGQRGRLRAGLSLVARGEFSIVLAGLATAAGVPGKFGSLAAAYVLISAAIGSVAMRFADNIPLPNAPAPAKSSAKH